MIGGLNRKLESWLHARERSALCRGAEAISMPGSRVLFVALIFTALPLFAALPTVASADENPPEGNYGIVVRIRAVRATASEVPFAQRSRGAESTLVSAVSAGGAPQGLASEPLPVGAEAS
ncbi:MAG: hypothetical protein EBZ48_05205, partial [Proteobacteria bacterium]|nr:hypothetical protein [Pseudomonadota bacterium]